MRSDFEVHIKTGTLSMANRVPEGRKPVRSKSCFDFKTDKEGKVTTFHADP